MGAGLLPGIAAHAQAPTPAPPKPVRLDNLPANDFLSVLRQRALSSPVATAAAARGKNLSASATRATNIGQTAGKWAFRGPRNTPANLVLQGRVNGVAYDPLNPNATAYAATANGGIWKTTTLFLSPPNWTPLGDTFPTLQTSCVAVDPNNNNIVYVGTGDYDGALTTNDERPQNRPRLGYGIMKSTNGGTTWSLIGTEMAGSMVSRIVIDPENTQVLTAITGGRFVGVAGGIWRSTDSGTTWINVTPVIGGTTFSGDWSDVEFSAPFVGGSGLQRWYYAALRGVGVFRSANRGASWQRITNVDPQATTDDLIYNAAATPATIVFPGTHGLEIATSPLQPDTVYIMDGSGNNGGQGFQVGRIYISTNAGGNLIDLTGNFPTTEGTFNNWAPVNYSSHLTVLTAGQIGGPITDLVFGGSFSLSAMILSNPANWSGTQSQYFFQHDMAAHPTLRGMPEGQITKALIANEGGAFETTYAPGNGNTFGSTSVDPFDSYNLFISELLFADFAKDNANRVMAQTPVGYRRMENSGGADVWDGGPGILGFDATGGRKDPDANPVASIPVPAPGAQNRFPFISFDSIGGIAIAPSIASGGSNVQFATTADIPPFRDWARVEDDWNIVRGGNGIGRGRRVFMTLNNWATAVDITPSRYLIANAGGGYDQVRDPAQNPPEGRQYVFNHQQNSSIASNWNSEVKPDYTALAVDPTNGVMYLGAKYLWRYNRNGAPVDQAGTTTPYTGVNLGVWHDRVGGTQLAAGTGYITAIAVRRDQFGGTRCYVGTSQGEFWMSDDMHRFDGATGASLATWQSINAPSLPSEADTGIGRPASRITAISINPTNAGDILVTLGGPGATGVYRNPNVQATNLLYTAQNGQTFTDPNTGLTVVRSLPGVPVNDIVRDETDGLNTWYAATDLGVFTTTNGGFDWYDATLPLGLPNVKCTRIQITTDANTGAKFLQVATFGRGVWRFDLSNIQPATTPPTLTVGQTLSRSGARLFVNLQIRNTGGVANQLRVTSATIKVGTSVPVASTTNPLPGPIALGSGQTQVMTVAFPGAGRRGQVAAITVTFAYTDSNGANLTKTVSTRTRLP